MSPPSDQDNPPRRADAAWAHTPTTAPSTTIKAVLPAEWAAPSIARDRVRRWLNAHRWSPTDRDDLVLAVSEAVSNSVEHGYGISAGDIGCPGLTRPLSTIEVRGQLITYPGGIRRVELAIRDNGRWLPRAVTHGNRGHGITIMRACTDEVTIDHTPEGTTVMLRSRPLPRRVQPPFGSE